ncbi:MAG TPA: hypothetical protein VHL80_15690 [Polyangia bacterium]|nr:hypothetical protein [Polyangia bacterium]
MTLRVWRVVVLVLGALGAAACTRNPYVIGTICPALGADGGAADPRCGSPPVPMNSTLAVGLNASGPGALGPLALASGALAPSLRLRGERATATGWQADDGAVLGSAAAAPLTGLGAPFTDMTARAVGLPAAGPAYVAGDPAVGAVGADDFALEVVFRALPGAALLAKQAGASGWTLSTSATRTLELDLGDATHAAAIASAPLTSGAWYHCLFWVSRAGGGRADCDGSAGTLTPLPPLGTLDAPGALLAAGGGAPIRVAHLALFRVQAGGLGDPATWLGVSAQRFATLTGVYPSVALGTPLPAPGLRASAAYVDLWDATAGVRSLYLVGPDWPRVACRLDASAKVDCGYLSEPRRARGVPADATAWQPMEVAVAPSTTPFPDGEPRFVTLAPSTATATHALSITGTAGSANQVFSFFARSVGTATFVGASGGAAGAVLFDLQAGRAVATPAGVTATIERWGNGIFRCTYALRGLDGPQTWAVQLLDNAGNGTFAGDGAPAIEVGGLQVDDGLALAGSLLAADPQPPDHLTFVADDGNLPTGTSGLVKLNVLVPAGARVNDQAILNVNRDGAFADQVQLFLVGGAPDAGFVKFWRLENNDQHWAFDSGKRIDDGASHLMTASWDSTSAHLLVDDARTDMGALISNAQPLSLNRIDVGFSETSSGALEGLVSGLQIGAM